MEERVERIMEAVSQPERVRAFLLLARPFQLEAGELTATLKVRRRHIIEKYRDRLDALYQRGDEPGLGLIPPTVDPVPITRRCNPEPKLD